MAVLVAVKVAVALVVKAVVVGGGFGGNGVVKGSSCCSPDAREQILS